MPMNEPKRRDDDATSVTDDAIRRCDVRFSENINSYVTTIMNGGAVRVRIAARYRGSGEVRKRMKGRYCTCTFTLVVLAALFLGESVAVRIMLVSAFGDYAMPYISYHVMTTRVRGGRGAYMCASSSSRCSRCFFSFSLMARSLCDRRWI